MQQTVLNFETTPEEINLRNDYRWKHKLVRYKGNIYKFVRDPESPNYMRCCGNPSSGWQFIDPDGGPLMSLKGEVLSREGNEFKILNITSKEGEGFLVTLI